MVQDGIAKYFTVRICLTALCGWYWEIHVRRVTKDTYKMVRTSRSVAVSYMRLCALKRLWFIDFNCTDISRIRQDT